MSRSFRELEDRTTRCYQAGDHRAALALLDANAARFPAEGHRTKIAFFRACLLAQAGDRAAALDVLEAGLADGLWWSPRMLADPDLDPCRGARLDRIEHHARSIGMPPARLVNAADPAAGVLLALHGGGEAVGEHDDPWSPAHRAGWTVHRPVSSQRVGAGLATWTDLDVAVDECRAHLDEIGRIDAIGSFSLGGSFALRLIAEVVRVPAIMIAPSLRPDVVADTAPRLAGADITIVTGDADPYLPRTEDAARSLTAAGAVVRVDVVAQLGHDVPRDFGEQLPAWLSELAAGRP